MSGDYGGGASQAPPPISTAAELQQRQESRATPAPEMHLTPGGSLETEVHTQVEAANEQRMSELQSRLDQMRQGFENDFNAARLQGHAKADFGHER